MNSWWNNFLSPSCKLPNSKIINSNQKLYKYLFSLIVKRGKVNKNRIKAVKSVTVKFIKTNCKEKNPKNSLYPCAIKNNGNKTRKYGFCCKADNSFSFMNE
jgi:hypothetical protein